MGLLLGLEIKLLSTDSRLIHQTAFGVYKHGHTFMIAGLGLFACSRPGARTGGGAFGAGFGLDAGGDGHGGCHCIKLEFPAGEFIIGPFVFEKDYFAEGLATRLKTDGHFN